MKFSAKVFIIFLFGLTLISGCGGGGGAGTTTGADLSALWVSAGTLNPSFQPATTAYSVMVLSVSSITLTPTAAESAATITVNGVSVVSGQPSSPISLNPGENIVSIIVTSPGGLFTKTYTITVHLFSQQAYVKASNTGENDRFGYSLSLSGDTLVVGAPFEDSGANGINGDESDDSSADSGAVYVFTRTGTAWTQQAYLKASNTGAGDSFGSSVSLSGDILAVGADGEDSQSTGINGDESDDSAANSGAGYVFSRTGTAWSQQAYLKASNTGAGDSFGSSVSLCGDTLAVGARREDSNAMGINNNEADNSASDSGALYIFTRSGTAWSQQAYIKASNTETGDLFGISVSISGDTLAVGASGEDSNATGISGIQTDNIAQGSGAAYVFVRSGTAWTQQAYIKPSNTGVFDAFGASVSLSEDILAVGAYGEDSQATGINSIETDNSATDSGAVYLFGRTDSDWSQQAYVKASNTGGADLFGSSVSISTDTVAVGARLEDSSASGLDGNESDNARPDSGAVYVFQ